MNCPYCSASAFVVIPDAKFDVSYAGASRRTTSPHGTLRVCAGCGHVAFFLADVTTWAGELQKYGVAHQRVATPRS